MNSVSLFRFFPCIWAVLAILCGTVGCNRPSQPPTTATTKKSLSPKEAPTNASLPKSVDLEKPVVRIETSQGVITAQLDGVQAPGTVRNFLNYANEGFYDNTLVHYVDPGKMLVAGGYSADHTSKQAHTPIRNEAHNGLKNVRGTLAMARDAAHIDSATSQFFINLVDAPQRDHTGDKPDEYGYCVFGHIIDGLEVAEKISQMPTSSGEGDFAQTPNPAVVIKSVDVVK